MGFLNEKFKDNKLGAFQFLKDFPNAMQSYQAAIKLDPTYSLAYFNGANLYFRNRQFQQAREYYDQAIRFNKKDEAALLNRAICKVKKSEFVDLINYQTHSQLEYKIRILESLILQCSNHQPVYKPTKLPEL